MEPTYPRLPPFFPKGWLIGNGWMQLAAFLEKKSGHYENVSLPLQASCVGGPFSIIYRILSPPPQAP